MVALGQRLFAVVPLAWLVLGCQAIFGIDDGDGGGGSDGAAGGPQQGDVCGDSICGDSESCLDCPDDCARRSCVDDFEPNNESFAATEIGSNRERCDFGICPGDWDWFVLHVPPDTHVRLRHDPSEGELDLEIYDDDYIDGSYDEGTGEDRVPLAALPEGDYAARVYGKSDDETIESTCYCLRIAAE